MPMICRWLKTDRSQADLKRKSLTTTKTTKALCQHRSTELRCEDASLRQTRRLLRVSENLCKRTKWSKQPFFRKEPEPCPFNPKRRHPNSIHNLSISCSPAARQPERLKTSSKTSARLSLKAPSMAN